jgi:chromosome partitioning protein
MNGKVIAVVNMKGGVGKSTTVVSLAETLAAEDGAPVLVIDLDAQATASYCLAGDEVLTRLIQDKKTVDAYFEQRLVNGPVRHIDDLICKQVSDVTHLGNNLDLSLLAASAELRLVERDIIYNLTGKGFGLKGIEGRARVALGSDLVRLRTQYKYILFDCAPGISAFTSSGVAVADLVVVPTIPDFLSHLGLVSFTKRIIGELRGANGRQPLVLMTKKKATKHHDEYLELIQRMARAKDSPFGLLKTVMKETQAFPTALQMTGTYPTYQTKYPPVLSDMLSSLADEIREAFE